MQNQHKTNQFYTPLFIKYSVKISTKKNDDFKYYQDPLTEHKKKKKH